MGQVAAPILRRHEERSPLGYVAFALVLYVVFDGFNHGMFDIRLSSSVSLTAMAILFAAFLVAGESLAEWRWPLARPYGLLVTLTIFVAYVAFSASWGGGTFDTSFVKNLLLVGLLASLVQTDADLRWVFGTIAAAGVWQLGLGLIQIMSEGTLPVTGLAGALPNHVQYAIYMALSAFAFLPFIGTGRGAERIPPMLGASLLAFGVLLSLARGVVIVLGVTAIVAVFLIVRNRRHVLAWIGGIFAAGFGLTLISGRLGTIIDIPLAIGDPQRLDLLLSGRLPLLVAASNMFLANPILGLGYGQFSAHWNQYVVAELGNPWIRRLELAAHSTYLQIMAELGIVGITLYVALIVLGFTYAHRALRSFDTENRDFMFFAAVAAFLGMLALAMHGVLDNTGWHDRVFYVYLALCTILASFAVRVGVGAAE